MANVPVQQVVLEEESRGVKANYTSALVSLAVLYFMMGFITCLNDTLVPYFKEGFTLTYTQSSLVQFYFFLTYGVMSIPAGRVVERVGYKKGMVLGFSIAALGATLFFPAAVMHQYYLFLAALFVVAIGIVLLQVAANPYITVLGPARTASSRFTLIQGVGSIGTTVAPLFGASFILSNLQEAGTSSDAVKYPYLGIAALLLVIAIFVSRLNLPTIKAEAASEVPASEGKGIFAFRNLKLGVWAIFCYVGAEVSIGTFLTNYIADTLTITEGEANNYVAFYWGSMLVGRLLGSLVLKTVRPQVVLSASAVTAILLIILSVSSTGNLAVWSMIAVGLCNSVMFAIIFSLSVEGLGKYTTKASGLLSTAIVGGAIVSFSQGFLIDHYTWLISFMLPLGCYLYILFYGVNGYRRQSP
ncbi:FHS family L-fucose permease-like MFS transporter [Pontibacter mucosus]|uniref:FHS family L-fucose permease-like MFS transporter n=1 Tax=Pontibacter mucosus TaxID=1649266 RepID=A0A2T5YHV2_9BACT|nr:sugar MFS transporter [Pontibacter mucosus]PTX18888.1 FHS family L-fucose permease-like MFS transporter [Pontibacter mucosus]